MDELEESNLVKHAKQEFKALGYPPIEECEDDPNKWIQENVLELLRVFSKQGHSGMSAQYCIELFADMAKQKAMSPLTGGDDEWGDVSEFSQKPTWQNKRCSHVFKDDRGAYDIYGKVFRLPDGATYTSKDSDVPVAFPYTPKTEYVDVEE
jgi:hypothetical protein